MWSRQVARAAGASLIAPLVLLLAAGVVASGGGLGGLGSLGQIASGPSLPETGLAGRPSPSIESAEIVGTGAPSPSPPPVAPPAAAIASATPAAGASPPVQAAAPRARIERRSSTGSPTGRTPLTVTGEGVLVDEPDRTPLTGDDQLDALEETTRGLGEALAEPLRPVGNQLVDLLRLLGLQPR